MDSFYQPGLKFQFLLSHDITRSLLTNSALIGCKCVVKCHFCTLTLKKCLHVAFEGRKSKFPCEEIPFWEWGWGVGGVSQAEVELGEITPYKALL